MKHRITIHKEEQPLYDIILTKSFDGLSKELRKLHDGQRKICIVSDSEVASFHMKDLEHELEQSGCSVCSFIFPAGEENKNLDTVKALYTFLIENHFDRWDLLIALGGGVVGDLTGYAAATYLRGIDFVQIPTSLLAQVDSSIGGKTGVDFDKYKNMVGAFHQPKLVFINLATLLTLSKRQYLSGMGEIIKHGLIKDRAYYEWLKEHIDGIIGRDLDIAETMVAGSCQIKRQVVEADPHEMGERALLNFGHTLGHAIEKLMNFQLLHGECVALGMAGALVISARRGMITEEERVQVQNVLTAFELPVSIEGLDSPDMIAAVKHDKKMQSGIIKFILLKGIGEAYMDRTVTDQEMEDAIGGLRP